MKAFCDKIVAVKVERERFERQGVFREKSF